VVGPDLGGDAPCDLAHRLEEGKGTVRELHGLVGDADRAGVEQRRRAVGGGGEMKIGEEDLVGAHEGELRRDGLLDFEDQVGLRPHIGGGVEDDGARDHVGVVVDARADARAALDEHLVAAAHEFVDTGGGRRDPVLVVLDLGGDPDLHVLLPFVAPDTLLP